MPGRAPRLVVALFSCSGEFLLVFCTLWHAHCLGSPCFIDSVITKMARRLKHQEGVKNTFLGDAGRRWAKGIRQDVEKELRFVHKDSSETSPHTLYSGIYRLHAPRPTGVYSKPLRWQLPSCNYCFLSAWVDVLLLFDKCVGEGRVQEMIPFGSQSLLGTGLSWGGKSTEGHHMAAPSFFCLL